MCHQHCWKCDHYIFQGLNKTTKSILKSSKTTKTVRIKEPSEYSEPRVDKKDVPFISVTEVADTNVGVSKGSEYVGYLNPAFEDVKEDDIRQEAKRSSRTENRIVEGETYIKSILTNTTTTKVFVTKIEVANINHVKNTMENPVIELMVENAEKRGSVYENVDVSEENNVIIEEMEDDCYENDTFHLAKDSALFSQVSRSVVMPKGDYVVPKNKENLCQVVEVKAGEIIKSTVSSVEPTEHVIVSQKSDHIEPQTVEIVEIMEDTETEPDESAPDTDPEDKNPSPTIVRRSDYSQKQKKLHMGPGEILAKRQKLASDEALRKERVVEISKEEENEPDNNKENQVRALLNAAGVSLKASSMPRLSFTEFQSTDDTPTPPPTPCVIPESIVTPLCLQMTDRVNRMEQTTVTAWKDISIDKTRDKEELPASTKEVTLRKEVEVSKTYQIIGSFTKPMETATLTVPAIEDNDSFYGSDKETDDIVVFSEDEGRLELQEDSSSSDDEVHHSFLQNQHNNEHVNGFKVGLI